MQITNQYFGREKIIDYLRKDKNQLAYKQTEHTH